MAYFCLFIPLYLFGTINPVEKKKITKQNEVPKAATQTTENETPSPNQTHIRQSVASMEKTHIHIHIEMQIFFMHNNYGVSLREFIGMNMMCSMGTKAQRSFDLA